MKININIKMTKCITLAVLSVIIVAVMGSFFTDTYSLWYRNLIKPTIQPPDKVFPIVWSINFILLGITLFFSCYSGMLQNDNKLLALYITSGILNILWSLAFFTLHLPLLAFAILLAYFVISMTLYFELKKVNNWIQYLLLPYLLLIFFAGVLNYTIIMLN